MSWRFGGRALVSAIVVSLVVMPQVGAIGSGGIGGRPAHPDPANPRTQAIFIMTLNRGDAKTDTVRVVNGTDKTQTIRLYSVDGTVTNTGAYTCRQEGDPRVDIGAWTQLTSTEVTLAPALSQDVDFTVTMPTNADVGEHNGCLVFQAVDTNASQGSGVHLTMRQAIRIVATVPGKLHREVTVPTFTVSKAQSGNPLYTTSIHNAGNVSADIDLGVTVRTLFGEVLYNNGGGYPVMSGQSLDVAYEQSEKLPFFGGWYKVQATVKYDSDATTFGTRDTNNLKVLTSPERIVFIAPTTNGLLTMITVALLVIGGLVYFWLRQRTRQQAARNGHRHVIKHGETVQSVAEKYNISWKKLALINKLKPPYILVEGKTLHVPRKKAKK